MARVSPRVQSSSLRHIDRVGQLSSMCQSVSVRGWMHAAAGHLSLMWGSFDPIHVSTSELEDDHGQI